MLEIEAVDGMVVVMLVGRKVLRKAEVTSAQERTTIEVNGKSAIEGKR